VVSAFQKGVNQGLAEGGAGREGNMVLASLSAAAERWSEAVDFYQAGMDHRRFQNTAGTYVTLGGYCLKAGRFDPAATAFADALDLADDRQAVLESIYQRYRQVQASHQAARFFERLSNDSGARSKVAVLLARCYLDLSLPSQARETLDESLSQRPTAEGFYWRAITARDEKDWDAMELAAQKATVLEATGSRNHLLLAEALEKQKKLDQAETALSLALHHSPKPDVWLYHRRAWIRWGRQDFAGAAQDWQQAIVLLPERADFYAHLAEAYGRLGNRMNFESHYRMALQRDPGNDRYRKRLAEAGNIKPLPGS